MVMRNYNNNNTIIKCLLTRKTAAQRLRRAQWLCALRSAHLRAREILCNEQFDALNSQYLHQTLAILCYVDGLYCML